MNYPTYDEVQRAIQEIPSRAAAWDRDWAVMPGHRPKPANASLINDMMATLRTLGSYQSGKDANFLRLAQSRLRHVEQDVAEFFASPEEQKALELLKAYEQFVTLPETESVTPVKRLIEYLRRVSTLLEERDPEYWHIEQDEDGTWGVIQSISPDWGMGGQVFKSGFATSDEAKEWVKETFFDPNIDRPKVFSVFDYATQQRLHSLWLKQDPRFGKERKPIVPLGALAREDNDDWERCPKCHRFFSRKSKDKEGDAACPKCGEKVGRKFRSYAPPKQQETVSTVKVGDKVILKKSVTIDRGDEWALAVLPVGTTLDVVRVYDSFVAARIGNSDVHLYPHEYELVEATEDNDVDTLTDKLNDVQREIDGFTKPSKHSDPRYRELKQQERKLKSAIRRREATTEAATKEVTREQIRKAIGQTWFDVVDQGDVWDVSSREYGDVGSETPGKEDQREGYRLYQILLKAFPGVRVEYGGADEWVSVSVDKVATGWQPTKKATIPLSGGEPRRSGILTHDVNVQNQYRWDKTYIAKAGTRAELGITNDKLTLYWHEGDQVFGGFVTQGAEDGGDFFVPKQGRLEKVKKAAFLWLPVAYITDNGYEVRPGAHDIGSRDNPDYEIVDKATGRVHYWAKGDVAWGQPRKYMVLRDVSDEAPEPMTK